jgi:hypothetical protein
MFRLSSSSHPRNAVRVLPPNPYIERRPHAFCSSQFVGLAVKALIAMPQFE